MPENNNNQNPPGLSRQDLQGVMNLTRPSTEKVTSGPNERVEEEPKKEEQKEQIDEGWEIVDWTGMQTGGVIPAGSMSGQSSSGSCGRMHTEVEVGFSLRGSEPKVFRYEFGKCAHK